jgi:hypothetical protein
VSLDQLKDFIDLYCNLPTYLCGAVISLVVMYIIRRIQVVYDYRRHRQYSLESCESSFTLSIITSFFWPITSVMLLFLFLKGLIEVIVHFLVNRVIEK